MPIPSDDDFSISVYSRSTIDEGIQTGEFDKRREELDREMFEFI